MMLRICAVQIFVFLMSLSSVLAWTDWVPQAVMDFIDNPMRRSTIPQFILDAKQQWILENKRKLERLPDAEAFLCELDGPSDEFIEQVDNSLEVPIGLFNYLEIDNNRYGISRPGWPNTLARLREMKRCPRALAHVKTFKVEIFVYDSKYSDWNLRVREPSRPSEELLQLFGDVLEAMTSLETLEWNMDAKHAYWFEGVFEQRDLILPSIKRLLAGSLSHYLVGMCPNLEALENAGSSWWDYWPHKDPVLLLVRSTGSAKKLTRFALDARSNGWTKSLISGTRCHILDPYRRC